MRSGTQIALSRLFSWDELVGWLLYISGAVELVFAWPWERAVGGAFIALGILDHARGVYRALSESR